MVRLLPSPEISYSYIVLGVWIHAIIGLSSFAAGTTTGWNLCHNVTNSKGSSSQNKEKLYGLIVAFAWCIMLSCLFWKPALLTWPFFIFDFFFVALAGILGQHISQRH
jgi:hypothetical protein